MSWRCLKYTTPIIYKSAVPLPTSVTVFALTHGHVPASAIGRELFVLVSDIECKASAARRHSNCFD